MEPSSLSATAIQSYEDCPAKFKADKIDKARGLSSEAADRGSCIHAVLERWVVEKYYLAGAGFDAMVGLLDEEYPKWFSDQSVYQECKDILLNWHGRQDWVDRQVISAELREQFFIPFVGGEMPVTFICDRIDDISAQVNVPAVEVIDYKSFITPWKPEDLEHKIQPRIYALAMQMKYPHLEQVKVTFDQVRYDRIGIWFSKAQNRDTWRYVQQVANRVWADDGTTERLGSGCRWCVRATVCESIRTNQLAGGVFTDMTLDDAIERAAQLKAIMTSSKTLYEELDDYIKEALQRNNIQPPYSTGAVKVKMRSRGNDNVDSTMAARVLGPDLMMRHGSLPVGVVKKLLKSNELTDDQREELANMITKRRTAPWLEFEKVVPIQGGS